MGKISDLLFQKARTYIPGGVNSPVRAGKAVGIDPPFISKANGPMILGHAHPEVVQALEKALQLGTSFGAPTKLEVEMAEIIVNMVPSIEMVRMVNSGTEATMSAIRLARGYTGREKIIKFDGCYHGHADSLLVSAGSGVATLGIPGSPGVPQDLANHTISLPFNDMDGVDEAFKKFGTEIAAVIVEPVPGNMGVIVPDDSFLRGLREITREHGALLIFDEVISGFRVGPGGAQELYDIMPDLTCLGKIIGGGLPVGAYGGNKEIMAGMAPEGNIYQAGTLSGNPLAMTAGLTTLKILEKGEIYPELENKCKMLFSGLEKAARAAGIPVTINRIGSMGSLFFTSGPVNDFAGAKAGDENLFKKYYRSMLEQGIYLAPSPFETSFLSTAHSKEVIQRTIDAAAIAFSHM